MANHNQHCSFCGKPKEETRRLISGPDGVCICDDCVDICKSMVDEWKDLFYNYSIIHSMTIEEEEL